MAAFEGSVSDILESTQHSCYCLDWHLMLQILGFRVSDGLEVLRRESPTQGQKQLYGPKTGVILAHQKEFGWFIMGTGLCSSTKGTDRASEAGGSSQLSSGFFHWLRACGPDVLCYRGEIRGKSFPFTFSPFLLTNTVKQSPNCHFSITVSSPAWVLNWKPSTNPVVFQIGLLSTAIKKKYLRCHTVNQPGPYTTVSSTLT